MSPERLDREWWLFLPGEQFTDSQGNTVTNKSEYPVPIRVHEYPTGLRIQAQGNNYSVEGTKDFSEVVTTPDKG